MGFWEWLKGLFAGVKPSAPQPAPVQSAPPPAPKPVPAPAPASPRSIFLPWEKNHPERTPWTEALVKYIAESKIPTLELADADLFWPGYKSLDQSKKIEFWAHLICMIAKWESNWQPSCVFHEPPPLGIDSVGIMQLSYVDQKNYSLQIALDPAKKSLEDPRINLMVAVAIIEKLLVRYGRIAGVDNSKWVGIAAYWSTMRSLKAGEVRESYQAIKQYMNTIAPKVDAKPEAAIVPPWMLWMRSHLLWSEENHDSQLASFWKYTNHKANTCVGRENAWCSMMANAALIETGFKGTRDAAALSFKNYGTDAGGLVPGCIVVIEHQDGSHHVTFLDHIVDLQTIACLGGNQQNAVRISDYDVTKDKVIATRWPVK